MARTEITSNKWDQRERDNEEWGVKVVLLELYNGNHCATTLVLSVKIFSNIFPRRSNSYWNAKRILADDVSSSVNTADQDPLQVGDKRSSRLQCTCSLLLVMSYWIGECGHNVCSSYVNLSGLCPGINPKRNYRCQLNECSSWVKDESSRLLSVDQERKQSRALIVDFELYSKRDITRGEMDVHSRVIERW